VPRRLIASAGRGRLLDPLLSSVTALDSARQRGAAAARERVTPRRLAIAGALLAAFLVPFTAGAVRGAPASQAPAAVLEPPAVATAPEPPSLRAVPALPEPPAPPVRRAPRPAPTPAPTPAPVATAAPAPEPAPAPAPIVTAPAPAPPAPAPAPKPRQSFDSVG
jgi:hypothetical protein